MPTKRKVTSSRVPYPLEIRSLHSDRLRLKEPVAVLIEGEKGQVIAYAPDLDIYGSGDDLVEALEDLRLSILDLYADLKRHRGRLGKDLQAAWRYLTEVCEESGDVRQRSAAVVSEA